MEQFSITELEDKHWQKLISQCKQYDFYHTSCYHSLEKDGKPLLFTGQLNEGFIALPLILRKVEDTSFWDLTSCYGYCGPVSNMDFREVPSELLMYFREELIEWFKEKNIISVFSRLHPVITGDVLFENFGIIREVNQTVAINLELTPEEQRRQYRKSNKSEINQLRGKKGYIVKEAKDREEILEFISIYYETMDRVKAPKNYYFDEAYFFYFLNNPCFSSKLLLALKDEEVTAGAIFTITKQIMQYHLAGTKEAYIRETPMKLILDEARLEGNKLGLKYLHLGGGVGGSDEDSLFHFKAGFSKERFVYRTWQYVVDKEKYEEVCKAKIDEEDFHSTYFPLYRAVS